MKRLKKIHSILNGYEDDPFEYAEEFDFEFCHQDTIVYQFYDASRTLIYVGIAKNFSQRLLGHKSTKEWFKDIDAVLVSEPMTRNEAHIYEIFYISKYNPKYNTHFAEGRLVSLDMKELSFYRWT